MARKIKTLALCLSFALAWSAAGQPGARVFQTLEALAAQSEIVVRGTIVSVEKLDPLNYWDRWPAITFAVDESLKGDAPKSMQFVIPYTSWPDRLITNWIANQTPLLIFLSDSTQLRNRQVSRFRYAPLGMASVVDLSSNDQPELLALDHGLVRGAAAILAHAKTAIEATRSGAYDIISTNHPPVRLPTGYGGYFIIPVQRKPGIVLRPDRAPRFTPKAQYDGHRILAARGNDALLWDAETGMLIRKFSGSTEEIQAVTFCPVGDFSPPQGEILTGSGIRGGISGGPQDRIRLWNVEAGTVQRLFGPLMGPVLSLQWAPDASRFISLSYESSGQDMRRHRLWEDFGATELFVFPGEETHFSLDGAMVLSRSPDNTPRPSFVAVWDARTYLQLCTLPGEHKAYFSANFSPYGNRLVTTARLSTNANVIRVVEVWDAETGRYLFRLKGAEAMDASYTHDGTKILTANRGKGAGVGVWNAESGKRVRTLACPGEVHHMVLSLDGRRCVANWGPGQSFGAVEGASLWDIDTGKELLRLKRDKGNVVGFSVDGITLFAFGDAEGTTGKVWSTETGKMLRTVRLE